MLNPVERARLREALKASEGTGPKRRGRLFPYRCPAGKLTIGFGRNIEDKGISVEEASHLLENDIDEAEQGLQKALPWVQGLDQVRQRVLVDMAFNMGLPTLLTFKNTLAAVKAREWEKAAAGMRASKWARQVGARAERLAKLMEAGSGEEEA